MILPMNSGSLLSTELYPVQVPSIAEMHAAIAAGIAAAPIIPADLAGLTAQITALTDQVVALNGRVTGLAQVPDHHLASEGYHLAIEGYHLAIEGRYLVSPKSPPKKQPSVTKWRASQGSLRFRLREV